MDNKNGFRITTKYRLIRAWESSAELAKLFEAYHHDTDGDERIKEIFSSFAKEEAVHAAELLKIIREKYPE